jgi:ubiquinone biosynthesis protein
MVGRVNPTLRRQFARMVVALYRQDTESLVSALLQIAPPRSTLDRRALRREVGRITGWLDGRALADIQVDVVANQIYAAVRHHRLALPPEVVQLFRMLVIVDGLGRRVDPGFDLTEALFPFARRLIEERLGARQVATRVRDATLSAAELGLDLPAYARSLMERVEDGGVDVTIRAGELDPLVERLERTGDRMVAALVVAAMITGGTNVVVAYKDRLGPLVGPLVAGGGLALSAGSAYLAWTGRPRAIRPR